MAGRGMGAATKGGGAVESGPRNKVLEQTSRTSGPVMMARGGEAKMARGGMAKMARGGAVKKNKKARG